MNEPYDRKLVKGVTTTNIAEVVQVDECIRYIEACGWKLRRRTTGYYAFNNPNANIAFRDMVFTLKELRHAYHNGW